MFFWNSLHFSMSQRMLAIRSLVPLPFLNLAYTPQFMYYWSLAWRGLSINFTSMWNEPNCVVVWHSLTLPFFGIGMKTSFFQCCGLCWDFLICWGIECSTLTTLYFRILNSSAEIPSPPLALFIVILPKAPLASYCTMSSSRLVTTPSWLSR